MPMIVTVVGARPQFIKAAPVSEEIRRRGTLREVLIHTGQHYDANMSSVFFDELSMSPPEHNLAVGSGSHGDQTAAMLRGIERILKDAKPAAVLVYGDTNSTLAASLAAAKLGIPIAHVEAGLRSYNRSMPEEINRVVTDHLSSLLLAPTRAAMNNLAREGLGSSSALVGDVMYDATLRAIRIAQQGSPGVAPATPYILATIHRAENTDDPHCLRSIFDGLARASATIPVLVPLHPRTAAALQRIGWVSPAPSSLRMIDPVGYLAMIELQRHARLIVTDSGGVQKEAYFHRVPCVTLRTETEWVELVEHRWNRLVFPEGAQFVADAVNDCLLAGPGDDVELYGDGTASLQIIDLLERLIA